MTRYKAWIWVILMALVLPAQADERAVGIETRVPETIRATEGFELNESAGLFVGIRTFDDGAFAEVLYAVDDAVDLAHLFALELELSLQVRVALLEELERLDGSIEMKRNFAFYFNEYQHRAGRIRPTPIPLPPVAPPSRESAPEERPVAPPVVPQAPSSYKLIVEATPADSRISIMNIRPVYEPGMSLAPGHYHIQVEREGYRTARQWVTIHDRDIVVDMTLEWIAVQREAETTASPSTPPKTWRNPLGMEFVLIPSGRFQMGTPEREVDTLAQWYNLRREWVEDESPQHDVMISRPFYLGKYEVTQAQWQAVMGNNPSAYKGSDHPVESVSWEEVQDFIRKLNDREEGTYRLPTEAEWEYAARGSEGRAYPWGHQFDSTRLNFCDQNCSQDWKDPSVNDGYATTSPVGRYESGRSPFGVYDMAGNVWEWMQDWYGEYPSSPQRDPSGPPSGTGRVVRGGSWYDGAGVCRSAIRSIGRPGDRHDVLVGFRLLRAVR